MMKLLEIIRKPISIPCGLYILLIFLLFFVVIKNFLNKSNKPMNNQSSVSYSIPENSEMAIFNLNNKNIKKISDGFLQISHLNEGDGWIKFINQYNIDESKLMNEQIHISYIPEQSIHINVIINNEEIVVYLWKCKDFFDLLPIGLKIDNDENLCYKLLTKQESIKMPIEGKFIKNNNEILRVFDYNLPSKKISYYVPVMTIKEWQLLHVKYPHISMNYIVTNREGVILHMSNGLKSCFECVNENFLRIQDFYNFLRGKVIPDTLEFNNIKNHVLNIIRLIQQDTTEVINTMHNSKLLVQYYVDNCNQVWIVYNDITKYTNNLKYYDQFKSIVNKLTDIIVCFTMDNKMVWTNSEICNSMDYIQTKVLLETLGNVEEIQDSNKKFIIMNYNLNYRLETLKQQIDGNCGIMERLFDHLSEQYKDSSLQEYGKYNKFLFLSCKNFINGIININNNKSINIEFLNITNIFFHIEQKFQDTFTVKNIEYDLDNLEIKTNKIYISNIFECLLQLAFKYQFDQKKLTIKKYTSNKINILLSNINNSKTSEIFNMLSVFNCHYGQCYIDNIDNGNLNIGFHVKVYD